jgi:hypothetical protein
MSAHQAIARARAAWREVVEKRSPAPTPTFAEENLARFEPFTATLSDGIWEVRGTIPPGYRGYVPEASVRQGDGFTRISVANIQ